MALARTHREWSILVGEYNICKKKLQSKREALQILTKEWQSVQQERDIYKNKINQLQQDLDKYIQKEKKQLHEKQQSFDVQRKGHNIQSPDLVSYTSKDSISHLLIVEYKEENRALKKDLLALKRLYVESQEDVQILRERMRKQSSSSSIGEESSSKTDVEGKEELILQLEEYKEQVASLEQELKSIRNENSDVLMEREHYKDKCERLNTQLNYILGADDRRLVDVDALVLDNQYLKEKLTQVKKEWNLEKESIQRYEAVFEKKKNKLLGRGSIEQRLLLSHYSKQSPELSLKTVSELRDVANILSETITEKNLALSHQKSANRILGKRVSELENKLKTLEVAGLWSLPDHRGYGSVSLENGATSKGDEKLNNKVGEDTPIDRLEWDNTPNLVELAELEKTKMEINGNDLKAISEILHDSKKNSRDFNTPDLLPKEGCISENNSHCSASDMNGSGCRDDCVYRQILSQSTCLEQLCEQKYFHSSASHRNNGVFHSDIQKCPRSNSDPCLFRRESWDSDDQSNGGPSCADFDAKLFESSTRYSEDKS